MFRRLKQFLGRGVKAVGAYFAAKVQKWNESSRVLAENNIRQLGFQELTPLEEARIRTGFWNPRW